MCFSAQFKIYGKRGSLLTFLGWDVSKRLSDGSELSCWALLSPPAIKLRSESKKFIFMTTSEYNWRALIAIAYLPLLKLKCLVHLKFETVGIQNNNCLRLHICSTESIINFFSTSIWWSSKFKRLPSPNQRAEPSFVEEFRALYRRINVRAFLVELCTFCSPSLVRTNLLEHTLSLPSLLRNWTIEYPSLIIQLTWSPSLIKRKKHPSAPGTRALLLVSMT